MSPAEISDLFRDYLYDYPDEDVDDFTDWLADAGDLDRDKAANLVSMALVLGGN